MSLLLSTTAFNIIQYLLSVSVLLIDGEYFEDASDENVEVLVDPLLLLLVDEEDDDDNDAVDTHALHNNIDGVVLPELRRTAIATTIARYSPTMLLLPVLLLNSIIILLPACLPAFSVLFLVS